MPANVTFTKESEAQDYADEIKGVVKESGDGGYIVIEMDEAGVYKMADGGIAPAARAASLRDSIGPELLKTGKTLRKTLRKKFRGAIKGFKGTF